MKRGIIALLIVLTFISCRRPSTTSHKPENTGSIPIEGTVKERGTGNPIANVKLTLSEWRASQDEGPGYLGEVDSTTTNDSGAYAFDWRMKDDTEYSIAYERDGYYDEYDRNFGGYGITVNDTTFNLLMSAPAWAKFTVKNTNKTYEGFRFQNWEWMNVVWDYDLDIDTIIRQVPGDQPVKFIYYKYVKNEYSPDYVTIRINTSCPTRDTTQISINY